MSDAAKTETAPAEAPKEQPASEPVDEIAAALAAVEAAGEPEKDSAESAGAKEPKKEAKDDEPGEKKGDEEPKGPAAKGWAAVRRVEQKLQKRQKDFEAKEQQFTSRMQQIEQYAKNLAAREAELDSDPVAYLTKKGLSFDDVSRRYLNDGKASPEEIAKRSAAQQSEATKAQEDRLARIEAMLQQREVDTTISGYKADIKTTIAADEFELLRAWPDAEAEVFEFADKWADRTKEVLTPRDAALRLQAELKKQLAHLSSHQAVRNLLAGAGNGAPSKQAVSGQSQAPRGPGGSPRTLTNNLAATPAAGDPDLDALSEDEQIQAALRLVQDA